MTDKPEMDINADIILEVAKLAGCMILEYGGETYRAEETAFRICCAGGFCDSDIIAIPTGIFITMTREGQTVHTQVKRIRNRTTDLKKLDDVNSISRAVSRGEIAFDEALNELKALSKSEESKYAALLAIIYAGLATGLFALVFGGSLFDAVIAFLCGIAVQTITASFGKINIFPFATAIIGSAVIAIIAITACRIFHMGNIDTIIIGGIIPLLPGLAITNAIRDTIMGDLLSGASRLAEVLLTSVGIAGGVGLVISVYLSLGGVL